MSKSWGRLCFVGFIWIYSLIYYLECIELDDPSEKVTIIAVFWLFCAFVLFELIRLIRELLSKDKKDSFCRPGTLQKLAKDNKTHLVLIMIVYLIAIDYLGFYASSFLAFCGFSLALGNRGFFKVALPGVVVLVVIFFTFTFSLKLVLPHGFIY